MIVRLASALAALMAILSAWAIGLGMLRPRQQIAFMGNTPGESRYNIYLLDAAMGLTVNLTRRPAGYGPPVWSPDGRQMAFVASHSMGTSQIYLMDADGRNQRLLTPDTSIVSDLAWSPDGAKLAYNFTSSIQTAASDLYVLDLQTGTAHNLTHDSAIDRNPVWSPDGRDIAFLSNHISYGGLPIFDLYAVKPDGSDFHPLTCLPEGVQVISFSWSPDSQRIAFATELSDGKRGLSLMTMDADCSSTVSLMPLVERFDLAAAWSPDGCCLIEADSGALFQLRLDSLHYRPLASHLDFIAAVAVSPDGQTIAFTRLTAGFGATPIYMMDADGNHTRAFGNVNASYLAWRPG